MPIVVIHTNGKHFDADHEANRIICEHTSAFMSGCIYNPDDARELYESMLDECGFLLTNHFLNGTYNPMEYNAIRNSLAKILYEVFKEYLD